MIEQAVILAGGQGTRLRPVTYEIPKPLIPVQGKPIATWQIRWLQRSGVKRVLIVTPDKWHAAFVAWRDQLSALELGLRVEIDLWREVEPMGTLGALVHEVLTRLGSEAFIVTNGDELKALDLHELTTFHDRQKTARSEYAATIALIRVFNPSDYGVAEMQGDLIQRFHEKPAHPPSNLISSGLYVVEPSALAALDRSQTYLMFEKDLFPPLAAAGRLGGCPLSGQWYDCGTLERWEKAIHEWKET